MDIPQSVLPAYGLTSDCLKVIPFGNGLINDTWKIHHGEDVYILQRVNETVFKDPPSIAHNIKLIAGYLDKFHPDYKFVSPLASSLGDMMIENKDGFFRLFPFVNDSHSKNVVDTPEQAYEAATQFGRFTRLLSGMDVGLLRTTLLDFHNLTYRYQQFFDALKKGNKLRIWESKPLIKFLKEQAEVAIRYEQIKCNRAFKVRVTHHDTKISNVLFNNSGNGICVIDLDTVMPGYFFSDVGDMMRTYLSPVSEEEEDFSKIDIREDFYIAIVQGYCAEMKDELTETEKQHFFYAGKFMIYMQALRFLTDHINDDAYYGAQYPGHNFVRAKNQVVLLQRLLEKETVLHDSYF